jgi:hypothetical protein
MGWDAANQIGKKGVLGILEAYSRADEEQGRGTLHGHWLIWIKEFGRLRDMLYDGDSKTREKAKEEFIKYLNLVMNASYPDEFEVAHWYEGECLHDDCNQVAVDGKHYCHSHSHLEPKNDKFIDCDWQEFRDARHEDGCHKVGGRVMTCKLCKEKGVPSEKVVPREAAWAGLEQMGAELGISSLPNLLKGGHGEERARLDIAALRHVYDLDLDAEICKLMESVEGFDLPHDFDLGNGPIRSEDDFWKDPTVRRTLLRLRHDDHAWTHVKSCFKKGCECRFFFPFLISIATEIYEDPDPGKDKIKRYKLDGSDVVEVPRYGIQLKRHQGSQYMNTHSPPISDILNCNTNVSTGDIAQLMYQTLYVSKNTQDDDDKPRHMVAARVIRSINRREEMDRVNGVLESDPDFVEGLKRILSAINAATSRDTVSAPMAANLVHQKGTRFKHSHDFQPLLLSQIEDELEGRSNTEGKFTVRTCQTKTGSTMCWPDKSANDYIYRHEDLKDMCLYQLTMHYKKSFAKKELKSRVEGEKQSSSGKLRFTSKMKKKHPGHNFAYLKEMPKFVIPIVHLRKAVEDEEDHNWDKFAEEAALPSKLPSGQPSEQPSDENSGEEDVADDEPAYKMETEDFLRGHICRLAQLELSEENPTNPSDDNNPSEKVGDDRERYAKLANMLFCPYRELEDLKIDGSYWKKFDMARRKHFATKKEYPCFESMDEWRKQYVDGFWAKGFEILQNMENRSAAKDAKGRAETPLTRETKCHLTEGGKKKKKRDDDNVRDISYFFADDANAAEAEAGAPEIDESNYRFNHNKLIDKNIGSPRLLNARLLSKGSIFIQDESTEDGDGNKETQTKNVAGSKKETDAWRGKDYRTKIKLMAGSLVGNFQDVYSSLDSEGESCRLRLQLHRITECQLTLSTFLFLLIRRVHQRIR